MKNRDNFPEPVVLAISNDLYFDGGAERLEYLTETSTVKPRMRTANMSILHGLISTRPQFFSASG